MGQSFVTILLMFVTLAVGEKSLPLFDPLTCHNMCRSPEDCVPNAACMPITSSRDCGVCVCIFGYEPKGDECVKRGSGSEEDSAETESTTTESSVEESTEDSSEESRELESLESIFGIESKSEEESESESESEEETTVATTTSTKATTTTTSDPNVWDCKKYECDVDFATADDFNPLIIRTARLRSNCSQEFFAKAKQCSNLVGGTECAGGGDCLKVDNKNSYCVCPYSRVGVTCHIEKTGSCQETTGVTPTEVYSGRRYRHIRKKHVGSVFARHYAPTIEHCIRLCEWAEPSRCRSINFGEVNGKKVCELLTVWAHVNSPLHAWLEEDEDWTYACCFRRV